MTAVDWLYVLIFILMSVIVCECVCVCVCAMFHTKSNILAQKQQEAVEEEL